MGGGAVQPGAGVGLLNAGAGAAAPGGGVGRLESQLRREKELHGQCRQDLIRKSRLVKELRMRIPGQGLGAWLTGPQRPPELFFSADDAVEGSPRDQRRHVAESQVGPAETSMAGEEAS